MSYFLENEEVNEAVEEVKAQDGIASIEPLLDNRIVRAIREMGFEKLSPIQEQAIPYLLQGEDIIGQALRYCRSTEDRISAVRSRDCGAYRLSWEPRDVSWTICADALLSWIW